MHVSEMETVSVGQKVCFSCIPPIRKEPELGRDYTVKNVNPNIYYPHSVFCGNRFWYEEEEGRITCNDEKIIAQLVELEELPGQSFSTEWLKLSRKFYEVPNDGPLAKYRGTSGTRRRGRPQYLVLPQ